MKHFLFGLMVIVAALVVVFVIVGLLGSGTGCVRQKESPLEVTLSEHTLRSAHQPRFMFTEAEVNEKVAALLTEHSVGIVQTAKIQLQDNRIAVKMQVARFGFTGVLTVSGKPFFNGEKLMVEYPKVESFRLDGGPAIVGSLVGRLSDIAIEALGDRIPVYRLSGATLEERLVRNSVRFVEVYDGLLLVGL